MAADRFKSSLTLVLQQNAVQKPAKDIVFSGFKMLRESGYQLSDARNFKGKHMERLIRHWRDTRVADDEIRLRTTVFRDFAYLIGKPGLVESVISTLMPGGAHGFFKDDGIRIRKAERGNSTRPSGSNRDNWKRSLAVILKQHNRTKLDGSIASFATRAKRSTVLYAGFQALRDKGYKIDDVRAFKERHLAVLAKIWETRGFSPSTIQNNVSIFRLFAGWIGKGGMIKAVERYVSPGAASRSSVNRADKSWSARSVNVNGKIAEVLAMDARVGLQLKLQAVFGLRTQEAIQLRPHIADMGTALAVTVGTKGGRERMVPIDTPEKRALLDLAKTFADSPMASTSDPSKKLHQAINHYYYVLRSCGITRKDGITSHGLRHGYANDRYHDIAGSASPVRGGGITDRQHDRLARLVVAEELGHSRESVTTHYLGR